MVSWMLVTASSCGGGSIDGHSVSPPFTFRSVSMEIGDDLVTTSAAFHIYVSNDGTVLFYGGHFANRQGNALGRIRTDEFEAVVAAVQRADIAGLAVRDLEACSLRSTDQRGIVFVVNTDADSVRFVDHYDSKLCPEVAPVKELRERLYDIAHRKGWISN